MVQAIIKNHSDSELLNWNEYSRYEYDGTYWTRNESIKLHRYSDMTIEETGLNPRDLSIYDYVELSKTCNNKIIQSELLTDSIWKQNNVIATKSPDFFVFPDNASPATSIRTPVNILDQVEYDIHQLFAPKLNKTYIYSFYTKNVKSSVYSKAAITVKDITYGINLSASFNLDKTYLDTLTWNRISEDTELTDLELKFYYSDFTECQDGSPYFTDYRAKLIRILKDDEYYFRPFITFTVMNNTNISLKFNLLNDNGSYIFRPLTTVTFFMSGAQLEEYDKIPSASVSSIYPSPYITTYKSQAQRIIPTELYKVNGLKQWQQLENGKVYYLKSVSEYSTSIEGETRISKRILSSDPKITNPNLLDIAVVQSTVNFGTVSSTIKKTYTDWEPDTPYKLGSYIKYTNNIYQCNTTHVSSSFFKNDILKWTLVIDGIKIGGRVGQEIILETGINSVTLKKGSRIYYPNGFESDNIIQKYDFITISNDITYNYNQNYIDTVFLSYSLENNILLASNILGSTSGEDNVPSYASKPNTLYYKLDDNKVYYISEYGNLQSSLPLAVITRVTEGNTTDINRLFSGYNSLEESAYILNVDKGTIVDYKFNFSLESVFYDEISKTYRIKEKTRDGDKFLILCYKSNQLNNLAMIHALTYNQGKFQTWDEQVDSNTNERYLLGYNTGGNYNFVKLSKISDKL